MLDTLSIYGLDRQEALKFCYPDGRTLTVDSPKRITTTRSGYHCIDCGVDQVGIIVAPGWSHIEVYPKPGCSPL
jgi:hypothetical protein